MVDRIAVYGTLRRGEANHHVVSGIPGDWVSGTVRGWTYEIGWGDAAGYPGLSLDDAGPVVDVDVLSSPDLGRHLERLDRFEGPGYRRVVVDVSLEDRTTVEAWIYEAVTDE